MQQTAPEIRGELEGTLCKALIVHEGHDPQLVAQLVEGLNLRVLQLNPSADTEGLFSLSPYNSSNSKTEAAFAFGRAPSGACVHQVGQDREGEGQSARARGEYNGPLDIALVLHTSGTSGKKKMVPYTLETLCVGAACIMDSWALTAQDVCLNMMPLFHVGGITRNILAAVLAGGGVVCAPGVLGSANFMSSLFLCIILSKNKTPYC